MKKVEGYIPIASTPHFNQLYVKKWGAEEKNSFADFVFETIENIRKKTSRVMLLEAMSAIDILNKEAIDGCERPISCKKGCSSCCYINVSCTNPEAKLALDHAKEHGIPIDKTRLKQQFILGQDDEQFIKMDPQIRKCVFLKDDGDCAIYEVRPLACRNYFTVSDPVACNTIINPYAEAEMFVGYRPGLILAVYRSAIIMLYGIENAQTLHNFLYKWTKDDGLPEDTGAVPEQPRQVEPASVPHP